MCDDVIMQSRPDGAVHIYYSTKSYQVGLGIRHRMTRDAGKTWVRTILHAQRLLHSLLRVVLAWFACY